MKYSPCPVPEQRAALPQPGAEVAPSTPAVAESRLSNGMRVLVAPTQGLPLVSARLGFDAGSSDDPAGKAGVASLTAALLTQGTATRTAPQIATEIEQLGASVGAGAGVDCACALRQEARCLCMAIDAGSPSARPSCAKPWCGWRWKRT